MKKFLFFLSSLFLIAAVSCNKEAMMDDDALVDEIAMSTSKVTINVTSLPDDIQDEIDLYNFDSYVDEVNYVSNAGYEVVMGDEETVYFTEAGRRLNSVRRHFLKNKFGPCGGKGTWIKADSLPPVILEYIASNYPDATIKAGKEKNEVILVLLDTKMILVFEQDGTFVKETAGFHHCPKFCKQIEVTDLSAEITDYLTINYPDAEIKAACQKYDKVIVVGILTPDGRRVVVFDIDGNFLFTRP